MCEKCTKKAFVKCKKVVEILYNFINWKTLPNAVLHSKYVWFHRGNVHYNNFEILLF